MTNPFLKKKDEGAQKVEVQQPQNVQQQTTAQETQQEQPVSQEIQQEQPQQQAQSTQPQNQQQVQPQNTAPPQTASQHPGDNIPEGVNVIDLDTDVKINALQKLPQLKLNETMRFALVLFNDRGAPMVMQSEFYYDQFQKVSFLAPKDKELRKKVISKYGDPKIRFGTIALKYDTDQYGHLLPDGGYELYAFVFSTDKWLPLKQLHKEWNLYDHDLSATCTEAQFQKWTIQVCRESLFRGSDLEKDVVEAATQAFWNHLPRFLGQPKTDQEILALLGEVPQQNVQNPFQQNPQNPQQALAGQVGQGQPQSGNFNQFLRNK